MFLPDGWTGEVIDLSATGLRIRSLVRLQRHTEIEATLQLHDGSKIALHGKVIWVAADSKITAGPTEFGLELEDVPREYFTALATLFADSE